MNRPLNVVFDYQIFALQEYGGVSRYFCALTEALARIPDTSPAIIAPFHINRYLPSLPQELRVERRVPRIPLFGPALSAANQVTFPSVTKRANPDVIHETYFTRRASYRGAPCVVTVHDLIHERFPKSFSRADAHATSLRKRDAVLRADQVICISENTRADVLNFFGIPEERVSVVYLASNLQEDRNTRETASVPVAPYLLYVGTRQEYKNFTGFLRAFSSSRWLMDHLQIVCFGGGRFSVRERGLMSRLGFRDGQIQQTSGGDGELRTAYRQAAALIYPSRYEGFGLPPLEAMSQGCPVLCSGTSSLPEVVGDAAECFDPSDDGSILAAMENVLQSPTRIRQLQALGYARAQLFSWSRCAMQTRNVYGRLT